MIRKYCDRCNGELGNTYWKSELGRITHQIYVGFNEESTWEMLLCEQCFKDTEYDLTEVLQWFITKEKDSEYKE